MKRAVYSGVEWVLSKDHYNPLKEATAMQQLSLGIDWGTQFSQLFGLGDGGEIVVEERVRTLDERVWRALLERLRSAGYSIHAGFEIGAHYDWLYDLLKEYCAEVSVIEPSHFAIISKSQRKTDKMTLRRLQRAFAAGIFRPCTFRRRSCVPTAAWSRSCTGRANRSRA